MAVPANPKIYHIVHIDRLPSIIEEGFLWCDVKIAQGSYPGTTIGMTSIKQRRFRNPLTSHPELCVSNCVPFYFCPRSVMLYMIHVNSTELTYRDGQSHIVHLEADLWQTVVWAEENGKRWAFTTSNAGSNFFDDYCDLDQLDKINWNAVRADRWSGQDISPSIKENKQAEFLLENRFPWHLIERIGVCSQKAYQQVTNTFLTDSHSPRVEIIRFWYY